MIKHFFIRLFRNGNSPSPMQTIFFSETKDLHLIGKRIRLFKADYLVENVVLVSWLKKRDVNKYVPLYAVRGRKIEFASNGGSLSDDIAFASKGRI